MAYIKKLSNKKITLTEENMADAIFELFEGVEQDRNDIEEIQYDSPTEVDVDMKNGNRFRITVEIL